MSYITDRMTGREMDLARRVFGAGLTKTLAEAQKAVYKGGHAQHNAWADKIDEAKRAAEGENDGHPAA